MKWAVLILGYLVALLVFWLLAGVFTPAQATAFLTASGLLTLTGFLALLHPSEVNHETQ